MTVDTSAAPGHGQIVCVTGAGDFIASWLVKLLLERSYTVKGTVRNPDDPKNQHLKALDGAAERLVLCKADLTDYDGYGIESWARGSRYRGQYRQGLRHGLGVYRFYNGDSYAGEWLNGQSHGTGVQTCSDGSCYVGEFKCGVKHGLGCYHFRNGDKYNGEYFGDKIHGFGVYHFANGHRYKGLWHEGRRQDFGIYTFRNSETRSGEWDYGVLKTPLTPSDPAVQCAVQASRKAAVQRAV